MTTRGHGVDHHQWIDVAGKIYRKPYLEVIPFSKWLITLVKKSSK
jgi:hypothetical protein